MPTRLSVCALLATGLAAQQGIGHPPAQTPVLGREVAVSEHWSDGEEFTRPLARLLRHGARLFSANWTVQEGAGRPLTKGNGAPLSDPSNPLVFPRGFNRISANDANSCAGCHNAPFGIAGGGGDFVTGVFVLGQRFDFATFDPADLVPTRGTMLENGQPGSLQSAANYRATLGMFGSGYIELLAREMTVELQGTRNQTQPGQSRALVAKGISFGWIARAANGAWDTSGVTGLPAPSLASTGPANPPNLIVRPFHQAGAVISLRQFTNNAFNHHHGIQTTERFGVDTDVDGDSHANEMTRADVTAVTVWQATLAVPGRVIPRDPQIEAAIHRGEQLFTSIGCASCHVPALPLASTQFVEPNPFNPAGNLRPGDAPLFAVNLNNNNRLPLPRLTQHQGVTMVPAFTDLKLHDICSGPSDPNVEALDMQQAPGSPAFFAGNRKFLTKRLWGCANEPPYFHHGQFTTLREAILAHAGEAAASQQAFVMLSDYDKDSIIECLKSLQVLPPGTEHLVVDEDGEKRSWTPSF
ncbi:MAG: di-heme oxidoredictase family protein [Planctomycetota bacterium]